jgi:hypothetical protein
MTEKTMMKIKFSVAWKGNKHGQGELVSGRETESACARPSSV